MNVPKNLFTFIDNNFFDLPPHDKICKRTANKFPLDKNYLVTKPSLFLSFNTSKYTKHLIVTTIHTPIVFLKPEIIAKIEIGKLTKKDKESLIKSIGVLINNGISLSIINGEYPTIFGVYQKISRNLALFLFDTNLNIRFLTFNGEYFASPVWSSDIRKCKTSFVQQLTLKHEWLSQFKSDEIVQIFNDNVPSPASIYSYYSPLQIKSNKLACNLESIIYCCPNCKTFFSVYSEYSCLKCKSCRTAIEFLDDTTIAFSKSFSRFDEIEDMLFSALCLKGFDVNPIIEYKNIAKLSAVNPKAKPILVDLTIYADHIKIKADEKFSEYSFDDIVSVNLTFDNTIVIKLSKGEDLILRGKNKENLYIIYDLNKLNKK